jgi:hypothetical protein
MANAHDIPVEAELTRADLLLINNALNEVCNGVHIEDAEFQTRLGASREEARKLLQRLQALL